MSVILGTFSKKTLPLTMADAHIIATAAFFEPPTVTSPSSFLPPLTTILYSVLNQVSPIVSQY
jgi:hypothetical protein